MDTPAKYLKNSNFKVYNDGDPVFNWFDYLSIKNFGKKSGFLKFLSGHLKKIWVEDERMKYEGN